MDTDRIHSYIYSTNKLREIRGASLLLEQLNQQETRRLLEVYDGEEVFIGGGGVLATFGDKLKAESFVNQVQALYRSTTHIASITGVVVEIPDVSSEQDALRQARLELRLAKGRRDRDEPIVSSSYFRLCTSCNRFSVVSVQAGDEICSACLAKRESANRTEAGAAFPPYSGYAKFAAQAEKAINDGSWQELRHLPAKLDQLEGSDTEYIGFIHADVNGLGTFLEAQTRLTDVKRIGHAVENAILSALVDAIQYVGLSARRNTWPLLIIILGGDDLTLIVPAKKAVPLANALCLAFERHLEQSNAALAMSAGVVIAKPKYPAFALADAADDLARNAKRLSHELRGTYGPVATIDFQVIHTPTANELEQVRKKEYWRMVSGQEYWHTSRPVACKPIANLHSMHALLEVVHDLHRSDFPRNKLSAWADLIYRSEIEQILDWRILQSRIAGEAHQALVRAIANLHLTQASLFAQPNGTGTPYQTPLLDILEIYEFVDI